jgi:alpha-D-xyloside xylohydrolase
VTRDVYLPAGTGWVDAWTGDVHQGGTVVTADTPPEDIPVFHRRGADLPLRPRKPCGTGVPSLLSGTRCA